MLSQEPPRKFFQVPALFYLLIPNYALLHCVLVELCQLSIKRVHHKNSVVLVMQLLQLCFKRRFGWIMLVQLINPTI